jgi:hypothetical protein
MQHYSHMELQELREFWEVDIHLKHWTMCLPSFSMDFTRKRVLGFIDQLLDRRLELMEDRARGYRITRLPVSNNHKME